METKLKKYFWTAYLIIAVAFGALVFNVVAYPPVPKSAASGNIAGATLDLTEAAGDHSAAPTVGFGDGDSGFYESADDILNISLAETQRLFFSIAQIKEPLIGGSSWQFELATATNPIFIPGNGDTDTGLGAAAADQLSLIAGGVEGIRITEAGDAVTIAIAGDTAVTGKLSATTYGSAGTVTDAEFLQLATIGANTISADQWAGLGGATAAGMALWDDAAAVNQRTTLGLIIGTDVLAPDGSGASLTGIPLDSDFGSNGLMQRTGAGTYDIATADTDYQTPIVWGLGLAYSAPDATFAPTELDDVTWGASGGGSQTWTFDTGAGTDPTMTVDDSSFTFNKEIIATSFNTGGSATPGLIMRDTDAAGAADADEYTFTLESGLSTTTEDGEISDFALTAWGAGTAGTQYTHLFWDGSDSHLYMGVLADYTAANPSVAPLDVATYESLVWDFDYGTDMVGVSSPVSGTTAINFTTLNLLTTGTIQGAVTINSDANGMTQGEMTAVGMYGSAFFATGAGTWDLPAAAAGMSFVLYSTGANAIIINPDDGDTITYAGVKDTAGHQIASPSGAGDFIAMIALDATDWIVFGHSGTWVPGA